MPKFDIKKHDEKMREILNPKAPLIQRMREVRKRRPRIVK